MLEYCFQIPQEILTSLIDGDLKRIPKKKFFFQSLIGNLKPTKNSACSHEPHDPNCLTSKFSSDSDSGEDLIPGCTDPSINDKEIAEPLIFGFKKLSLEPFLIYSANEIITLIHNNAIKELDSYFKSLPSPNEFINSTKCFLERSFLHVAVLDQKIDVILLLKKFGANISALDRINRTPLHYAANWPKYSKDFCEDSLNALFTFEGAYIVSKVRKDNYGQTAITLATENGIRDQFLKCRKPLHMRMTAK